MQSGAQSDTPWAVYAERVLAGATTSQPLGVLAQAYLSSALNLALGLLSIIKRLRASVRRRRKRVGLRDRPSWRDHREAARRGSTPERKVPRRLRTAIVATSTTNDSGPTDSSAPRRFPAASRIKRARHDNATTPARTPSTGRLLPNRTKTAEANRKTPTNNTSSPRGSMLFHRPAAAGLAGSATTAITKVTTPGTKAHIAVTRPAQPTTRSTTRSRQA